jgi:hypothetical protein
MNLFQYGQFKSHSGLTLPFKIECDALTDLDWDNLAAIIATHTLPFNKVEGVPRGGLKLAEVLKPYRDPEGTLLIVDDVFTTGASMEQQRKGRQAQGFVVFARGPLPPWITALCFVNPLTPTTNYNWDGENMQSCQLDNVIQELGERVLGWLQDENTGSIHHKKASIVKRAADARFGRVEYAPIPSQA